MKFLLDTPTLIWFAEDSPQLSEMAAASMADPANDLFLSPASYWELAIKVGLGKYTLTRFLESYLGDAIRLYDLSILPITIDHAVVVSRLPPFHHDPFDRMLIAQAMVESIPILGPNAVFDAYPVVRLW